MTSKSEFFNVLPVQQVLATLFQQIAPLQQCDTIATVAAQGQVLAEAPISPADLPAFRRSTMDGYAVRAVDTHGASDALPAYLQVVGTVHMGAEPDFEVQGAQAAEIHTGAMLPVGTDAVVMIERTMRGLDDEVEVMTPVAAGENVLQIGEDIRAGAAVLPVGHRLRPQDIGGLLAVGITTVSVFRAPKVAVLSCGDELIAPDEEAQSIAQIRDINAYMLSALFTETGAEVTRLGIARDKMDDLLGKAQNGLAEADMLVMTAGSSVSTRDLTRDVIQHLGAPGVLQHGLAVKPGKPTIVAACDGKAVIGLPGNPVSAMSVARQVVLPIIRYLLHEPEKRVAVVRATLSANISSTTGREDTMAVRLKETPNGLVAEPVFGKSNLIYTLIHADGYLQVPLNSNGLKAGALVDIILF